MVFLRHHSSNRIVFEDIVDSKFKI